MAGVHLVGGGWAEVDRETVYGPFLHEAGAGAAVACLLLDEGDGEEQVERWVAALRASGDCRPRPVLVAEGRSLDVSLLDGADALLVCGGLTPAYARALGPVAAEVRAFCGSRPYLGFSAGAAVAAGRAVVGGWRSEGRAVCPEDAGEDEDDLLVAEGLGLVPFAVDVHAAQWGTLGRLVAAVRSGAVASGVALDEGTALAVVDGAVSVRGSGAAHVVLEADDGSVVVRSVPADGVVPTELLALR